MEQLIQYIEKLVKLDSEAMEALEKYCKVEIIDKNEHLLDYGSYTIYS